MIIFDEKLKTESNESWIRLFSVMKYQLNTTYLVILYNFQASGDDERNFINRLASKNNFAAYTMYFTQN